MSDPVLTRRDGAVLIVTINRPDKKNALTGAMYDTMRGALENADSDEAIRAVVIEGSGGSFSAGNDIGDFLSHARSREGMPALRFIKAIAACETPLVAAVDGVAVGVGTTLCLHCDLVYASPAAFFRMPFVDLGLVPEAGSSLLVPARVGPAKAAELLMLGDGYDAAEGYRLGLVNAVVPADALQAHALKQAHRLAAKPRNAIAQTRRLIRGDKAALMARIEEESILFGQALDSSEARDAFMAFMAKSAAKR